MGKKLFSRSKCTYLTFDLAVTLIRILRRGFHPGTVCYTPKNISSMDAEHSQKVPSKFVSEHGTNYSRLTIKSNAVQDPA